MTFSLKIIFATMHVLDSHFNKIIDLKVKKKTLFCCLLPTYAKSFKF